MATRADGQPADQHARARSIAEFLYQSNPSTTGPPPSPYVDGIDVPLSPDTSIDSPQFWGDVLFREREKGFFTLKYQIIPQVSLSILSVS